MDITILVNKNHLLSSSYKPEHLYQIDNNENNFHKYVNPLDTPKISEDILLPFCKMQEDFHKQFPKTILIVDSGYRSFEYQKQVYEMNVIKLGIMETNKKVALPGQSEHQTGLAIDIAYLKNDVYTDNVLPTDEETIWLHNNAYKYGFILRYPLGKEDITGYSYEPWHYRYVGTLLATELKQNNLTLEEYYFKELKRIKNKNLD